MCIHHYKFEFESPLIWTCFAFVSSVLGSFFRESVSQEWSLFETPRVWAVVLIGRLFPSGAAVDTASLRKSKPAEIGDIRAYSVSKGSLRFGRSQ